MHRHVSMNNPKDFMVELFGRSFWPRPVRLLFLMNIAKKLQDKSSAYDWRGGLVLPICRVLAFTLK